MNIIIGTCVIIYWYIMSCASEWNMIITVHDFMLYITLVGW